MKIIIALLTLALAGVSNVQAAGFTGCDDLAVAIAGTQNGQGRANDYCRVYLGLAPATRTATVTSTRATRTVSLAGYTTTTLEVTPDISTRVVTQRTTTLVTTMPATRTSTITVTSTAYVANDGETIAVAKRSLEARARPNALPAFFIGFTGAELRQACRCVDPPRATITRSVTRGVYATVTKNLQRTLIKTSILPTPRTTETVVNVLTKIVKGAAPVLATSIVEFDNVRGCPPSTDMAFLCPDGTAPNDLSDPALQTCGVQGLDGFAGNCLYWSDDGSPVESQLVLGDGSGNSEFDQVRAATYGDGADDDCPTWADWTCANPGSIQINKRSTIAARRPRNRGTSKARHGALKPLPKTEPKRGGSFVTFAEYQRILLEAMAAKANNKL